MEFLIDHWLPILLTTIALWLASFIAWVVLPHHYGDFGKLPDEDRVRKALEGVSSGNYMVPYAGSGAVQRSREYMERYATGPRATVNVYAMPNMGANMGLTIGYFLVTVIGIAYVTALACPEGTSTMQLFRVSATIGVLTYATSGVLHRIWFKARIWTDLLDGLAYGLILGGIFAALW